MSENATTGLTVKAAENSGAQRRWLGSERAFSTTVRACGFFLNGDNYSVPARAVLTFLVLSHGSTLGTLEKKCLHRLGFVSACEQLSMKFTTDGKTFALYCSTRVMFYLIGRDVCFCLKAKLVAFTLQFWFLWVCWAPKVPSCLFFQCFPRDESSLHCFEPSRLVGSCVTLYLFIYLFIVTLWC